jgi:streptogramin lyase
MRTHTRSFQLALLTFLASSSAIAQRPNVSSRDVLARLPEGPEKRQFIIDCTNCHQFESIHAYDSTGAPRSRQDWETIVARMLSFSGATTAFPIMSKDRTPQATAAFLARLYTSPTKTAPVSSNLRVGTSQITEFMMPMPQDLGHDIAIDSAGTVVVTGMFSHTMYTVDTATKRFTPLAIPVDRSNPRAIEIGANGEWHVVLGNPNKLARYRPSTKAWTITDVGMYAHSVALDAQGRAWFNGHFTRSPEVIGYVNANGTVKTFNAPKHPTMSEGPGGPIPYELRAGPDGRVWMSELQGNRVLAFDPSKESWDTFVMPVPISAPRRLDVAKNGLVWIPAYASNALYKLDAATRRFTRYDMPETDAIPYIARVNERTGQIWIGTSGADAVYSFDPTTGRFTAYRLPERGAVIRHLTFDPRNNDVWLAYGASPGIAARIARLRVKG